MFSGGWGKLPLEILFAATVPLVLVKMMLGDVCFPYQKFSLFILLFLATNSSLLFEMKQHLKADLGSSRKISSLSSLHGKSWQGSKVPQWPPADWLLVAAEGWGRAGIQHPP